MATKTGWVGDLEASTRDNTDYRRVLYTAAHCQLVLMSLRAGEEIGEEVHELDQFIRFESGRGVVILEGSSHPVSDGVAVVIPAGTRHNVRNTSSKDRLQLYSVYAPPEHKDGTIHRTKAQARDEHFDGVTTE